MNGKAVVNNARRDCVRRLNIWSGAAATLLICWFAVAGGTPARGQTLDDSIKLLKDFIKLVEEFRDLIDAGNYMDAEQTAIKLRLMAETQLADQPVCLATAFSTLGITYYHQGRYALAEPFHEQALGIYRKTFGDEHPQVAASLNDLAILYHDQRRYAEAEPLHREALAIRRKTLGDDNPDVAASLNNLASLYCDQGRFAEAERLHKEALGIYRKTLGDEHPQVAASLSNLANVYSAQGHYGEGEPLYRRALEIRRKALGNEHPQVAASLYNLASAYRYQRRYAEAEPLYIQALGIRRKALGDDHPDVADSLNNLANLYADQGRYAEAEPLHKEALGIRRKTLGDEHPDVATSLNNIAALYGNQGRYAEAEPLCQEALEIRRETLGEDEPDVATSLDSLALLYFLQCRYADAEPLHKKALGIRRKTLGDEHPDVATSLNNIAALYGNQGRYAEAEPLYQQALRIRRKILGDEHPDVAASLNNLASLYCDQGRNAEAEPLLDEAQRIARRGFCDPRLVAHIHSNQGRVFWDTDRKPQATAALEQAIQALEQQRTQISGAELERAAFLGRWTHLFELMVSWQYELGQPAEAFRAMERSRARALLDQMQTAGMDLLAGLPEEEAGRLRQQESEAAGRVSALRKQFEVLPTRRDLTEEEKEKEEERLSDLLRAAQTEYAQAYAEIRNASPAYRLAVSDDQKPVTAEKLAQWVDGHQALVLEYLLGEEGGYVFVLPSGQQPQLLRLEITAAQAATLGVAGGPLTAERMRAILAREDETGVLDHLRASQDPRREEKAAARLALLWEVLVPEAQRKAILEAKYERLVVLPDASLAQLPFETLVVESVEEPKYLLDAGPPIMYAPSATILLNLGERESQASRPAAEPVLAVGDCLYGKPAEAPEDTLLAQLAPQARYRRLGGPAEALPYSAWEIAWVAEVYGKNGIDVAHLKGALATERNVRHNVTGRRVLDFACHGRVDQRYGNLFGALALTPGPDAADPANDGLLTLAEIYELDLAGCELAILSACDTNVGPHQRGEGVWALSRGFLAAGARRVAASNWLLDDEAAASTVSYFCAGVAQQEASEGEADYAHALHKAKRWVRSVKTENHDWTSPYYWAPMVLIGP